MNSMTTGTTRFIQPKPRGFDHLFRSKSLATSSPTLDHPLNKDTNLVAPFPTAKASPDPHRLGFVQAATENERVPHRSEGRFPPRGAAGGVFTDAYPPSGCPRWIGRRPWTDRCA